MKYRVQLVTGDVLRFDDLNKIEMMEHGIVRLTDNDGYTLIAAPSSQIIYIASEKAEVDPNS